MPPERDRKRRQPIGGHERGRRSGGVPDEEASRDLVVGHETRQVEAGVALFVECPAELEAVRQYGPHTPAASIDPECPRYPSLVGAPLMNASRTDRGDAHDLTGRSIARDERLVHIAKGRGERRIRLPFERQSNVAGQRVAAEQLPDRRVIVLRRQGAREARAGGLDKRPRSTPARATADATMTRLPTDTRRAGSCRRGASR